MNPKLFIPPLYYEILCPYCFNRFTADSALFVDFKDMAKRRHAGLDDYYRTYFGKHQAPGEVFPLLFEKSASDDNTQTFSARTYSGDISYHRACPSCNNLLPAAAGKMKTFSIAVMGSSKKEKDMYITTMLHKLYKRMLTNFNASFIPADFTTAELFYREYEKPLYVDKTLPTTETTVVPLLYEFTNLKSDTAESRTKKDKPIYNKALVMLYNIDKEIYDKHKTLFNNIVARCDGYLILSDTPEFGFKFDEMGALYDPWLGFLTEALRAGGGFDRIKKPSAIVLNRINKIPITNKIWKSVLNNALTIDHIENGFPYSFFLHGSRNVKKALKKDFPEYYSAIDTLFGGVNSLCFALNAFYNQDKDDIYETGFYNASDIPLLWLLSKFGMIPEDGGKLIKKK